MEKSEKRLDIVLIMKGIYNLNHELKYSEHQKLWNANKW